MYDMNCVSYKDNYLSIKVLLPYFSSLFLFWPCSNTVILFRLKFPHNPYSPFLPCFLSHSHHKLSSRILRYGKGQQKWVAKYFSCLCIYMNELICTHALIRYHVYYSITKKGSEVLLHLQDLL